MMSKLQVRFMYLTVRFMAKFMLHGAEEMRNTDNLGVERFTDELITLGDDLREELNKYFGLH